MKSFSRFSRQRPPFFLSTLLLPLVFLLAGQTGPCRAEEKIAIGLLPEMNVFKQMQRFQPLADYLSQKIGLKVELSMLSRYGNIIDRLETSEIDAAFLGSFTGALAISQLNVEPLARPVNLDGTSTYHGHLFVRRDSGITDVAGMRGKTLVLVEHATTAGYIFPLAYFKRHGVDDLDSYFKEHYFAGSHDATVSAVLDGQADVGVAKNTIYERMISEDPRVAEELVILASSPMVPSNGLCARQDMDEELKNKLKEALLGLDKTPEGKKVLEGLGATRFVPTSREDYQPVRDMAAEAGIVLKDYKYYNP